jgi:hypothetical protein
VSNGTVHCGHDRLKDRFIQDSVVCLVYTCLTEPHQWCNCKCAGFECGVDRGSEKTLESVFVASPLSTQH